MRHKSPDIQASSLIFQVKYSSLLSPRNAIKVGTTLAGRLRWLEVSYYIDRRTSSSIKYLLETYEVTKQLQAVGMHPTR
jgi:hypothetical protein